MLDLTPKKTALRVRLLPAGIEVECKPGQSILDAALASEIAYPHNCQVGSCTTCKGRLRAGKIKELSDVAYVLSEEEIGAGTILACQSVPQTDVTLEVDLD
ncbi:MAG: 2Fe-2S iron-sulfur cluster binding domain-containing protein [Leptospirales bacterium]|nr:2Fe-2S iron-sulfur cluster binding domain-containing protein [Leptospirales bacterium]